MALIWYTHPSREITWDNVSSMYSQSETGQAFIYIESLGISEFTFLHPWMETCQKNGIEVHHFYDDSVIQSDQLAQAITLLKQTYTGLTKKTLAYEPPEERNPYDNVGNAYKRMLYILEEAQRQQKTLVAFCD